MSAELFQLVDGSKIDDSIIEKGLYRNISSTWS